MYLAKRLEVGDYDEFKSVYDQIVIQEFPEYTSKTREYFVSDAYVKDLYENHISYGAFAGENIVGFFNLKKPHGGILFITWLGILKAHQKKGVGKMFLEKIEEIALQEGVHAIHLEAFDRNKSFYEKNGYFEFGYDKNSYFGVDEYLMKKEIQVPKEENWLKH